MRARSSATPQRALVGRSWTQDRGASGGRIIGDACHFVDLLRFLTGVPIASHHVQFMQAPTGDTATITLSFGDGSIGTVHYFANGSKAFAKEQLEVFAGGRILQLHNFRRLAGFGWPGFSRMNLWRQDKGHNACAEAFVRAGEQGGQEPITYAELVETCAAAIDFAGEYSVRSEYPSA